MEMHMIAGVLMHPIAIAILAGIVMLSAVILYSNKSRPPSIAGSQLGFGYLGVAVTCLLIAAIFSYVSPEASAQKWKVPADQYWNVLGTKFLVQSILLIYISFLGVAIIGAPIIFMLARRGKANMPWVLISSVVVSLCFTIAFFRPSEPDFVLTALSFVFVHLLFTFSFGIGARLPWESRPKHE